MHDSNEHFGIVGTWDKEKNLPVFDDGWLEKSVEQGFVIPEGPGWRCRRGY